MKLTSTMPLAGALVAEWLHGNGVAACAPMRALDGAIASAVAQGHVLVFPWIAGVALDLAALSAESARTLGRLLRAVHRTDLPTPLKDRLERETFQPWGKDQLPRIASAVFHPTAAPFRQRLAAFWAADPAFLPEYFRHVGALGAIARRSEPHFCLCHNDLQSHNLLVSDTGVITLLDWDNPVWAPPEVDFLHLPASQRSALEAGYGPLPCNADVVAYVEANWLLQETFDCSSRLLFSTAADEPEQRWAWQLLERMLPRMQRVLDAGRQ